MLAITFVVVVLLGFLVVQSFGMRKTLVTYEARKVLLEKQIEAEERRTEDIDRLKVYMATDAYAEEVAREKLRFVRPNEIVFVEEE